MNYKAIEILKSFSSWEMSQFGLFLKSPYCNKSPKTAKLFRALSAFHPEFEDAALTEERLYSVISPHLQFNRSSMRNLFADLSESLENFLIERNLRSREFERNDILREELFRRKLWKHVSRNIKKSQEKLDKAKDLGTDHFLESYKLATDKLNLLSTNKPKTGHEYVDSFLKLMDERAKNISGFFIKEIVRQTENITAINKPFRQEKETDFTTGLSGVVNFKGLTDYLVSHSKNEPYCILLELYQSMFMCFSAAEDKGHYYRYKDLVLSNTGILNESEVRFHLIRLVRYCMLRNEDKRSDGEFDKELFDVYSFIIENKYYKTRITDHMPDELFRTIVIQSLKLREFGKALEIINGYISELHPDRRENMHSFANALYSFHKGDFVSALKYCMEVKLNQFVLKVDVKNLMLMTYYELNFESGALSLIDTYKHFLSKNELLSKSEKQKHSRFISVISKLLSLRNGKKFSVGYDLKKLAGNDLPNKEWVDSKLKELKVIR